MSEQRPIQTSDGVRDFLKLSVSLTGFSESELWGTGMTDSYYDTVNQIIGEREMGKLLGESIRICHECGGDEQIEHEIEKRIMDSPRYGPVARNILRLWYLGAWSALPGAWRNEYGATSFDTDHIVSAAAYRESLVWPAGETHPMGAKQEGFGAWAKPRK